MTHQAAGLDRLVQKAKRKKGRTRFVAITSGKGGVGKSTLSANLAYTLWKLGFTVGLMDADIGLANLDVLLGVKTEKNILHLLRGQAELSEILVPIEEGFWLIPGESGDEILKYSDELLLDRFLEESALLDGLDFLLIDTGAGIGETIQNFLFASDAVVVVTVPEPAAITDAYATIKITARQHPLIYLVLNMVRSKKEADSIFEKLSRVARDKIEGLELKLIGKINQDTGISRANRQRELFVRHNPHAMAALDIEEIARNLSSSLERQVLQDTGGAAFGRFFKKILGQF